LTAAPGRTGLQLVIEHWSLLNNQTCKRAGASGRAGTH
jgi:hypothetical protein